MNNQLERLSFLTHSVEGLEVKSVTAKLGDKVSYSYLSEL